MEVHLINFAAPLASEVVVTAMVFPSTPACDAKAYRLKAFRVQYRGVILLQPLLPRQLLRLGDASDAAHSAASGQFHLRVHQALAGPLLCLFLGFLHPVAAHLPGCAPERLAAGRLSLVDFFPLLY